MQQPINDRREFLEIFQAVSDLSLASWTAKNGNLPVNEQADPPTFLDVMNQTLQFAWYVDGYRVPAQADDVKTSPPKTLSKDKA